jgi:hypothetical protein
MEFKKNYYFRWFSNTYYVNHTTWNAKLIILVFKNLLSTHGNTHYNVFHSNCGCKKFRNIKKGDSETKLYFDLLFYRNLMSALSKLH